MRTQDVRRVCTDVGLMDDRIARLRPHVSMLTALEFRELLQRWLAEFATDWTDRQREDADAYPPTLPLEEWWADFSEAIRSRTLTPRS